MTSRTECMALIRAARTREYPSAEAQRLADALESVLIELEAVEAARDAYYLATCKDRNWTSRLRELVTRARLWTHELCVSCQVAESGVSPDCSIGLLLELASSVEDGIGDP